MQRAAGHGAIPKGWRLVRLGDVANVQGGVGFPLDRQGRQSGDYPFIKVSDMNLDGNESYIRNANNYVDQRDAAELGGSIFSPGTIVFPKVGAAIATNKKRALTIPTIIDNNMVGITVSNEQRCNARFLHNWFESIDIAQFANVSTVPSITTTRLKREFILLPPLPEQRAIAAVLDSIDETIEGAEAVIAATEQLRDSLLHQLLTRGVPGWHTEWKEAPGLGTIPAGWDVVTGDVMFKLGGGYAPSDFELVDDGTFLFIKVEDLNTRGQSRYLTTARSRWNEGGSRFKPIAPPFIVFPKRGVAIFTNRVAIAKKSSVVDPNLMTVTTLGDLNMEFLRYLLLHMGLQRLCDNSGIPQINNKHLYPKIFAVPQPKEQEKIAAALSSSEDAIEWAREELNRLQLLKETAAGALLTGQVRLGV